MKTFFVAISPGFEDLQAFSLWFERRELDGVVMFAHEGTVKSAVFARVAQLHGFETRVWLPDPDSLVNVAAVDAVDAAVFFSTREDFLPGKVSLRYTVDRALRSGKNVEVIFEGTDV